MGRGGGGIDEYIKLELKLYIDIQRLRKKERGSMLQLATVFLFFFITSYHIHCHLSTLNPQQFSKLKHRFLCHT